MIVREWLNGKIFIIFKNQRLNHKKIETKSVKINKIQKVKPKKKNKPAPDHPWRQYVVYNKTARRAPRGSSSSKYTRL